MKAVLLKKAKEIGIVDVPEQDSRAQVTIKVRAMGICGSDVSAYKGTSPMVTYPRILGHEVAGEVIAAPENQTGLKIGDRVIVEPYMACGVCYPCQLGRTNCCEQMRVIGVHVDGGMREYYAHPLRLIHKVPDAIPWEHAPLIESLSISIHGIHRLQLKAGEYVLITGAGQIGLLAAQFALHLGAIPLVVEPIPERRDLAQKLGVKYVFDPKHDDRERAIRQITGGRLVEAFLEASGATEAIRSSLDLIHFAGRIVLVGWPKEEILLPTALITRKELDVRGSRNSAREFPLAIDLIAKGIVKVDAIITHLIELEQIPEYLPLIDANPAQYVKVVATRS